MSLVEELLVTARHLAEKRYGERCKIQIESDYGQDYARVVRSRDNAVLAVKASSHGPLLPLHQLVEELRREAA